ncbi:MAG: sirohydrochlorin cobaltochelatase [Ruminococcus sp.]|nr:sirohydrochlorin cobaltochelatase [Ruminococcus sp.]
MKKINFIFCLAMAGSLLTACADSSAPKSSGAETSETNVTEEENTGETAVAVDNGEDYTGDASLDNVRNQDGIGDNELLVISFGTSYNDSRRLTIGAIENALEEAFPDFSVRRGFTANMVIDHIQRRDGILIDDVKAALDRAVENEVKTLVIQPTHLMNGFEYNDIVDEVAQYSDAFEKIVFGQPLLTSDDDFKRVEAAITSCTLDYDDGKTAICFMGHGTEADSNGVYQKLQYLLTTDGYENYFIGTVEAEPSLESVIELVKNGNYERVVLEPLMVVCGDHAHNDMAGEMGSWKSAFKAEGYKVECIMQGLGENPDIQQIYVDHAREAIDSIY